MLLRDRENLPTFSTIFSMVVILVALNCCAADTPPHGCSIAVLVLSSRDHFAARQRIRMGSSWSNVFFLVGNSPCEVPHEIRKPWTCEAWVGEEATGWVQEKHDLMEEELQACLEKEGAEHRDMVFLPAKDYYRNLPRKLKEAFAWALHSTNATWFVKADDDVLFLDIQRLQRLLCSLDRQERTVVGRIHNNASIVREGKNAELHFRAEEENAVFPPFPPGSYGYAVSRDVAAAVVEIDGFEYQGEDVSLGIWLDESPLRGDMTWISHKEFRRDDDTAMPEGGALILGTGRDRGGDDESSFCPAASATESLEEEFGPSHVLSTRAVEGWRSRNWQAISMSMKLEEWREGRLG